MSIQVESLTKTFPGGAVALNDLSLSVDKGETVAIIGPSGAGKTTLFRALTRSIHIDKGAIALNGLDLYSLPYARLKKVRGTIGVIYQQHNLVRELSVATNVVAGLLGRLSTPAVLRLLLFGPTPFSYQKAAMYLDEVGIQNKLRMRAGNLSGGEQQRVAVARLLMQDPDIILADEPIASVDPISAERIMDALIAMAAMRGKTLICNIHNIDIARRYFTRVIAMRRGQLVFDGSPREFSAELLASIYEGNEDDMLKGWYVNDHGKSAASINSAREPSMEQDNDRHSCVRKERGGPCG